MNTLISHIVCAVHVYIVIKYGRQRIVQILKQERTITVHVYFSLQYV